VFIGIKPEAHFQCRECGTFQCEICEELLHENVKFVFHERLKLQKPAQELICQNNCETRNLSDINCIDCNKNYCFSCDQSIHSSSAKRRHSRKPFETNKSETEDENEEFISCQYLSNGSPKLSATEALTNVDLDSGSDDSDSLLRSQSQYNETHIKNEIIKDKKGINSTSGRIAQLPDIAQLSLDCPSNGPTISSKTGMSVGIMQTTGGEDGNSFLLIDENELLQVATSEEFAAKIGCDPSALIKVVSIFGNTGEGKSHTLNFTFFDGNELFKTSPTQNSCTIGIWCAYDPIRKVITIDTEGLLGISENNNRRTRLLLKVLAISDIIIYRTRAERLHNDLFTFLGDASRAYVQHFSKELRAASQRCNLSCPLSDLVLISIQFIILIIFIVIFSII
jgi:zinc finger FYVE domain-containing protein 1